MSCPIGSSQSSGSGGGSGGSQLEVSWFQCGDRLTPIASAANNVQDWMVPKPMSVSLILASLTSPATTGTFTVRLKRNGTTVLSTDLTFDAGEKVTTTASSSAVISDTDWTQGDIITTDVVNAADGTASGLKVYVVSAPITDSEPPTAPSGLTATAVSGSVIDLDWSAASDNNAVINYRVQRATDAGFTTNVVSTDVGNVLATSATGLSVSTTYYFRVLAEDLAGNASTWSNTANATTTSAAWDPSQLLNIVHEWNAKNITGLSNTDPVSTWADSIGSSDFTGSGTTRPLYYTNSGDPYVEFDGVNDVLDATITSLTDLQLIIVYERVSDGSFAHVLETSGSGLQMFTNSTFDQYARFNFAGFSAPEPASPTGDLVTFVERIGSAGRVRFDGSQQTGTVNTTATGTGVKIGNSNGNTNPMNCRIKAIWVCDGGFDTGEEALMATYISNEYGLTF